MPWLFLFWGTLRLMGGWEHGQVCLVHSLKGLSNGFKSHWSLPLETLLLEFAKH